MGVIGDPTGKSRELLDWALAGLEAMEHRGGCIDDTGDGAGLLFAVDPAWFARFVAHGKHVPEGDQLSVGTVFFPPGEAAGLRAWQDEIDSLLRREGLAPLGWRRVPVDERALGKAARESRREPWQVLIGEGLVPRERTALALWRVKARVENQMRDLYLPSFSPRTVVYKALCTGPQLAAYYDDLRDETLATDAVVFHRRYSTNTFSSWSLAQAFRMLGHNGEINSVKANRDAVRNLEGEIHVSGVLMKQGSDSADLDRVVELFVVHGVPLLESLVRLLPPAHGDVPGYDPAAAAFHRAVKRALGTLGAWEGPAGVVATDGETVAAILDKMGLRPLRYVVTRGGRLVVASELGAVPVPRDHIAETGQLEPGEAIALDLPTGRVLRSREILREILARTPINHEELAEAQLFPVPAEGPAADGNATSFVQGLFGWTADRVRTLKGMAETGAEPITSMGFDRPLAVFSRGGPTLFKYFKQIIAVVTNPAIDPIREGSAIDLAVFFGRTPRAFLDSNEYRIYPQLRSPSPFLTAAEVRGLLRQEPDDPPAMLLDSTYPRAGGAKALSARIAELAEEAVRLARSREASILVFSDREAVASPQARLPLPALLVAGAVHAALTADGKRRRVSVVMETGEVQEGHDAAVLLANGASAVCPWLAFDIAFDARGEEGVRQLRKAFEGSLKRVMAKMGITSVDGYRGSRLFEAVGLSNDLVEHYLPGTTSRIGGIDLADIDADIRRRADAASGPTGTLRAEDLNIYRKEVTRQLQLVARGEDPGAYDRFLEAVGKTPAVYLRDLLAFRTEAARPVPVEEVVPPEDIVRACIRGAAVSHGALHRIAHRAIAGAFNELGSFSNSGEGGEDRRRNRGGPWEADRSRVRQVASGRFGVDAEYLVNADELEIKIGQGAKPGEGGHLPAEKVTAEIAAIRRCPPGVALISPPPQHDIYSIEDLAQLIHNLRAVNPRARIGVKCPSVTDLGTIAVGVVKAGADVLAISGFEGGTGAAPASSIEHAGLPLERGLAEAHQALVLNGIRGEVRIRADGGVKTGDDVVKLLALGADEVALGTALMISEQCIFCHGCMKGTCPSGITTQDDVVFLRFMVGHGPSKRDIPEDTTEEDRYREAKRGVTNYLLRLAADVRGKLAALGLRHPRELTGRVDLLDQVPSGHPRADKVDLSALLLDPRTFTGVEPRASRCGARRIPPTALNLRILDDYRRVAGDGPAPDRIELRYDVENGDRAVGATLCGALAAGEVPLPAGGVRLRLSGFAGQGLGFALVDGVELELEGFANDGVAEAMGGGRLVIRQPVACRREGNGVAGNAVAYGAVGGEVYLEGRAGQRLGVRNSGGLVVAEGAGKYAFEYMTDGIGVLLGPVGPVLGSGLNGGVVFVHDPEGEARRRVHADAGATGLVGDEPERLRAIVEKHHALTGSPVAERLLARWPAAVGEFVAIRPAGQAKRMAEEAERAREAGASA